MNKRIGKKKQLSENVVSEEPILTKVEETGKQSMSENILTFKRVATLAAVAVVLMIVLSLFTGFTGKNDIQNYQIWQGISGGVKVIDSPGWYVKNFGTVWPYPKNIQEYYSASDKEGVSVDESIRVTFNDGGNAKISTFVQFSLPLEQDRRMKLHEKFGGSVESIKHAVHAHLSNCVKNSGPLMSATENQAARKAEYAQVVEEQLRHGLYQMRRVQVLLKDRVDDKGAPVYVEATEILKDKDSVAVRAEKSPLEEYGISITQFSITGTDYDEKTLAQFSAKQDAFLNAEKSKAQREEELQKKLWVVAQGERQAAEETAKGNVLKATQDVAAQTKVVVAEQAKKEAETVAGQKVSVAELEKKAATISAEKEAEVAKIGAEREKTVLVTQANAAKEAAALQAEADKLKASGIIALAEAEQKKILLGGAVKENDRVLATIQAERDVQVAANLSKIAVPTNIIIGGNSSGGQQASIDPMLLNLNLLKGTGLFDFAKKPTTQPSN